MDFFRSPDHEKTESEKEVYQNIAERVHNEQHDYQGMAAEIAVPDPHHPDLPGHGMLIEFCTSADSAIGRIGHQYGVHVIRCTEKTLNADDPATEKELLNIIKEKPGIDLHGSLPCGPWTQWTNMNVHVHGEKFIRHLEQEHEKSRRMLK